MMINKEVILFLSNNSHFLTSDPINGSILTIHTLFNSIQTHTPISLEIFKSQIEKIKKIDRYSIVESLSDEMIIEFINHDNLNILMANLPNKKSNRQLSKQQQQEEKGQCIAKTPINPELTLSCLNDLLSTEGTISETSSTDYSKLIELLKYKTAAHELSLMKIKQTTPMVPFVETCNDKNHSIILSQNNKHNRLSRELFSCLQKKIHFIPIIKPHTDISLGDCSYLDTCHKLDSCRYVHYSKHLPQKQLEQEFEKCVEFNNKLTYWEKINPWNNNGSVSNISREILDSQWINCDVRTFDFNILGKFAAVIADPAWNIHMNLPYGTCNDNELLNLPLSNIQDEGLLLLWVTGRTIEIGKESLKNWGYEIMNELIWIKTNQLSRTVCTGRTGHWLNHSKEHLLVGLKGNPKWLDRLIDIDFIVSSTRETSRKPDELYGMVERLVGPHTRKLEIFGRDHNTRPGWFTIGNQLNGTKIIEYEVRKKYEKSRASL